MARSKFTGKLVITPSGETREKITAVRERIQEIQGVVPDGIPEPYDYGVSTEVLKKILALDLAPHSTDANNTRNLKYDGVITHKDDLKSSLNALLELVNKEGALLHGVLLRTDAPAKGKEKVANTGQVERITFYGRWVAVDIGRAVILFEDGTEMSVGG